MGLKIFIHTDLEGVSGVVEWDPRNSAYSDVDKLHKRKMMSRLLTGEVNAAIRGAKAAGADTIYVSDNHGDCRMIDIELLDVDAELIHGIANLQPNWVPCLDSSFDAVIAVGMHAMAGSKYASLPHSCWHINDGEYLLSEATMCAALSGYYDVPFVFASGDQTITAEIREKIPMCETAVVKTALSPYFARCLHPDKARELIFTGVKKGIENRKNILPFKIKGPYKVVTGGRDPSSVTAKPCSGDDLFETVHRFLNTMPWNAFGNQEIKNKVIDLSPYAKK